MYIPYFCCSSSCFVYYFKLIATIEGVVRDLKEQDVDMILAKVSLTF